MIIATAHHPAQFSTEILAKVAPIIGRWQLPVHDPFAGPGVRLGSLCDELGLTFTGTEIEAPFIVDPRIRAGDSTSILTYPSREHVVVTSPAYANGMADHFEAKDGTRRHTYRQARTAIVGHDAALDPNNMGRHGARAGRKALARHFDIADRAVAHWPTRAIVNVSDFIMAGDHYPYVQRWRKLLARHGYEIVTEIEVQTPRQRHGANGNLRVDHEMVLVALRREVA